MVSFLVFACRQPDNVGSELAVLPNNEHVPRPAFFSVLWQVRYKSNSSLPSKMWSILKYVIERDIISSEEIQKRNTKEEKLYCFNPEVMMKKLQLRLRLYHHSY
eukprot:scaffold26046_cov158-Skeletonema_marinoi.AAC.4